MNGVTELDHFQSLMHSLRRFPISILFGNLGRQPYLLLYSIDRYFHPDEKVRILSSWSIHSRYVVRKLDNQPIDFLFVVEPYFGYTVQKQPNVKHSIVLTSHLSVSVLDPSVQYFQFFLTSFGKYQTPSLEDSNDLETFAPNTFHDVDTLFSFRKTGVLMNVHSRSAHEAYLKILTGREILRDVPYKISISPKRQEIIQAHVHLSKVKANQLWKADFTRQAFWNLFQVGQSG